MTNTIEQEREIYKDIKSNTINPVSYANPQDILDYKSFYTVRESPTKFHTVALYTQDQVDVIMESAINSMREKQVGEATPQPQTVKDALEQAAQICSDVGDDWSEGNIAHNCRDVIRALIQDTPESLK